MNTELLKKTLEHIKAHPETHDQSYWIKKTECGTSYCFAGHAVMLTYPEAVPAKVLDIDGITGHVTLPDQPSAVRIQDKAQELLDLNYEDGTRLFHSENSLEDLEQYVERLCNGESIAPMYDEE